MAGSLLPVPGLNAWLKDRFNAENKIGDIKAPILFFHGDADDIVPLKLGQDLFAAANAPKEMVIIKGAGHNNTYLEGGRAYFDKIKSFVATPRPASPAGRP
jgi:fermentation-respiration switch protein FrsA (DUF1100 family)